MFGALFIFGGILGSGVAGTIVEIKKNYKVMLTILGVLTAITSIGLMLIMRSMSVSATSVASFIVGSATISVLPVGIDFAVEISHPIPESISSGLLLCTG